MDNIEIIIFISLSISSIFIFRQIKKYRNKLKVKQELKEQWGILQKRDYEKRTIDEISQYYKNKLETDELNNYIDDITWNDLDFNKIYKKINFTETDIGEEYLYNLLREPLYDKDKILYRNNIINNFKKYEEIRNNIRYCLYLLGKNYNCNLSNVLYGKISCDLNILRYLFQSFLPIVGSLISVFVNFNIGVFLVIISLILNGKTYMDLNFTMDAELGILEYISCSINTLNNIKKTEINIIDKKYSKRINKILKNLKSINSGIISIFTKIDDPFKIFELLNLVFLYKIISFKFIFRKIMENKNDLKECYNIIGEIDSLIAIANYRKSLNIYTSPEFSNERKVDVEEIYHPLIDNPKTNSISESSSVLLTGSNASGKSVFLKSIAINTIFAQTISTVLAINYKNSIFKVISSIALRDNIAGNESYYMVELKSLKRINNEISENLPCLVFVDEVLRGTNTIERIASSSEILQNLSTKNCICYAATHDLELTEILKSYYENYHFQENIENDDVIFDYKLYKGSSKTRNAIKLLKVVGFDDKIIMNANNKAENYIKNGNWIT